MANNVNKCLLLVKNVQVYLHSIPSFRVFLWTSLAIKVVVRTDVKSALRCSANVMGVPGVLVTGHDCYVTSATTEQKRASVQTGRLSASFKRWGCWGPGGKWLHSFLYPLTTANKRGPLPLWPPLWYAGGNPAEAWGGALTAGRALGLWARNCTLDLCEEERGLGPTASKLLGFLQTSTFLPPPPKCTDYFISVP